MNSVPMRDGYGKALLSVLIIILEIIKFDRHKDRVSTSFDIKTSSEYLWQIPTVVSI